MSGAHVHLFLNHIPVLGTLFGLLLLAYAMVLKKPDVLKASLGVFVLTGLVAVAVYLTGEAAEEAVEHLPGISEVLIEPHEEAGLVALLSAVVLGGVSLGGLVFFRKKQLPGWLAATTLVLALAVSGVMGWTANLGGQISHPEIRSGETVTSVSAGRWMHTKRKFHEKEQALARIDDAPESRGYRAG